MKMISETIPAGRGEVSLRQSKADLEKMVAGARTTIADLQKLVFEIELKNNLVRPHRHRRRGLQFFSRIKNVVSDFYEVSVAELESESRSKEIVLPRHVAFYLMRKLTNAPARIIGTAIGGRDHGTVLHGCRRIKTFMEFELQLKRDVETIEEILGAAL